MIIVSVPIILPILATLGDEADAWLRDDVITIVGGAVLSVGFIILAMLVGILALARILK